MANPVVEISVRLFYTSEDVNLAPWVSVCFPVANIGLVNWPAVLAALVVKAENAVDEAPVEGLRAMTPDETAAYRASERG